MSKEERDKIVIERAKQVFLWYYIFGEDNLAAREHIAELGNALRDAGYMASMGGKKCNDTH